MTQEAVDNPFDDCQLAPDAILGTHIFEDVLFTDDTETLVNVLTDETPAHSQATVEKAKEFAASIDTETAQIALPASVESQVETQSKPYTAAAFFHFKATGPVAATVTLAKAGSPPLEVNCELMFKDLGELVFQ